MSSIQNSSYATQIEEVFQNCGLEVGSFDIRFSDSSGQNYTHIPNESSSQAIDDQLEEPLRGRVLRGIQNTLASEEMILTYLGLAGGACIYDVMKGGYTKG